MTIAKEAQELLATVYRLDETGRAALAASDRLDKLAACRAIVKAARGLLRNAEKRCNGIERWNAKARMVLAEWTDADEEKAERGDERGEKAIREALAVLYGPTWAERLELETQGDPRGAMVKVWPRGERDMGSALFYA